MSTHLLQNFKELLLDREKVFADRPKYDDDVIECMQFGICSSSKPAKEIPYYFHF